MLSRCISRCSAARARAPALGTLPLVRQVPELQQLQSPSFAPRCFAATGPNSLEDHDARVEPDQKEPPQLVRAGLVGATTALMTPLFPIIGFNQLVFRYATPEQKMLLHGGTSMLYFSAMTLMPNAFYYAPMLLPFAIGNGITAAGLYMAAEAVAGGPKQLAAPKLLGRVPVAGPVLGLATAFLVPWTYPYSWWLVYGSSDLFVGSDVMCNLVFSSWLAPCLATTGLASGLVIDVFLRPLILGVEGWPWQKLAGRVLAAAGIGLLVLYSTSTRTDIPHLRDADSDAPELKGWFFNSKVVCYINGKKELCWVPRLHHNTGQLASECLHPSWEGSGKFTFLPMSGSLTDGLEEASQSQDLLAKAQMSTVRCYTSHNSAYFDGFVEDALESSELSELAEALPIAETVMADALVILLAGTAPRETVASSLRQLQPMLQASRLARRLGNSFAGRRRSEDLLEDLAGIRVAQFRELHRLESGDPKGPFEAAQLRSSLADVGLDAEKVQKSLEAMKCKLHDSPTLRELDWKVLGRQQRQEQAAAIIGKLLTYGTVALVMGASLFHLKTAMDHYPKD